MIPWRKGTAMKVLLTGGRGMLGRTLTAELSEYEVIPTDLPEADITDPAGFDALLREARPDAVIHCAAMTAVDRCESERDLAFRLNAFGTGVVAAACNRNRVRLIAISTDYVFDGNADRPYSEFDRPTGGATIYGQSKFAGEELVINSRCEEAFRNYPSATFRSKRVVCDDLTGFLKEHGLPLNKIFLLGRPDQFPALRALLGRWEDVYITSSGPDNLEILARGVDKGTGIAALARRLGIPMEEVMGIGDSDNDRGMLAAVGMPVVMGNAAPEIQALGRHITDTNENAGVAKAIRHFLRREEA